MEGEAWPKGWPFVPLLSLGDISLQDATRIKNCKCCKGLGYHIDDPKNTCLVRFCDACAPARLRGYPDVLVLDDNPISISGYFETHRCVAEDIGKSVS